MDRRDSRCARCSNLDGCDSSLSPRPRPRPSPRQSLVPDADVDADAAVRRVWLVEPGHWVRTQNGPPFLFGIDPSVNLGRVAEPNISDSRTVAVCTSDRTGASAGQWGLFCQITRSFGPIWSPPMLLASELATTCRALAPDGKRIGCSCSDRIGVTGCHWGWFCQWRLFCQSHPLVCPTRHSGDALTTPVWCLTLTLTLTLTTRRRLPPFFVSTRVRHDGLSWLQLSSSVQVEASSAVRTSTTRASVATAVPSRTTTSIW